MLVVINDQLVVSITDNEEAAELLAGEGGSIIDMPGEFPEDHISVLTNIFQALVDETVVIMDNNRQAIELSNMQSQKTKKEMN